MNLAYKEAQKHVGTWEWKEGHNPKILEWFRLVGHPQVKDDETAWCAAFVGAMMEIVGLQSTKSLLARSYLNVGEEIPWDAIQEGDLVIFKRGNSTWQGHVGFAVRRKGAFVEVLGGNQKNQVNIKTYPKTIFLGARRLRNPIVAEKKGFWDRVLEAFWKIWRKGK